MTSEEFLLYILIFIGVACTFMTIIGMARILLR